MEYCEGGSVSDVMEATKLTLSEEEISVGYLSQELLQQKFILFQVVMRDILQGLAYLHQEKKIHRDIKGGNILLSEAGSAKLGMDLTCFFFKSFKFDS